MTLPAVMSLVVSLVACGSLWCWAHVIQRLVKRQPLLPYEPRETPPWNLLDVLITVMMLILFSALAASVVGAFLPRDADVAAQAVDAIPPETVPVDSIAKRWVIVLSGVASLVACGLGGLLIVLRTGASWGRDLGLTFREAGRDVVTGIAAYLILAPIIYAIQGALQHWFPSEHPLVESFRENPTLGFYLVCVFSAAIAAPLVEEFMCRVLLQGAVERVMAGPAFAPDRFLSSDSPTAVTPRFGTTAAEPELQVEAEAPECQLVEASSAPEAVDAPSLRARGVPILVSSLVFALLHFGNGLDPIPLFFLALGLGYVYQRTHRILPCVVVHFLVNAFALAMLAASLFIP